MTDPATGWRAVFDDDGMADVYCVDPECEGQYVTAALAPYLISQSNGRCVGCREAIAVTESAYRTFDPAQ